MKKYSRFETVFMILLVLLISCCSKTDRDEAKLQYNAQASNSNRQAVIGDLYYLASLAKDFTKSQLIITAVAIAGLQMLIMLEIG